MNIILIKNNFIIFYYNLCYLFSFIIIYIYIFKDLIWVHISMSFRIEYYSLWLIVLRFWILGLIIICLERFRRLKIIIFINLLLILVIFFSVLDLILFYFFFEVRLIPTFFLIIYWGRNLERLRASYYLIIYILIISFPLLIYIFKIYLFKLTFKFNILGMNLGGLFELRFWGYLIVYIAFYIKLPIFIFHVWLPKAHVEAPVYGSIILAGVLLKIGGYGLIRFFILFLRRSLKFNYLILRLRIVGGVVVGILRLIQVDLKRLVAYSSVVHMNVILCAFLTIFRLGYIRGYIIIISHGLCSSGLFYIVNLYYIRSGSRLLILNKGMLRIIPVFSLWWFLLCAANFSFPLSLNFIREIFMLRVLLNWDSVIIIYLILVCFFRRAYSLYLFSFVQHGDKSYFLSKSFFLRLIKEFIVLIIHLYPLIFILLNLLIFVYLSSLNYKTLICGIKNMFFILNYHSEYFYLF